MAVEPRPPEPKQRTSFPEIAFGIRGKTFTIIKKPLSDSGEGRDQNRLYELSRAG
jgi:hypothetical protein